MRIKTPKNFRKILDKLQYGDPEDESACFVRRFWRETSTIDENPRTGSPLSVDIAAIAERTASLEASLEEAFDGLRLRLQEMGPERQQTNEGSTENNAESQQTGGDNAGQNNSTGTGATSNQDNSSSSSVPSYYQAWDEETSIMNNPLNYDIWDELDGGNDAGPTITARINLAERRATSVQNVRRPSTSTTGVCVGTNPMEGNEVDEDSTDDEEVANYFQIRNMPGSVPNTSDDDGRRDIMSELGMSEEISREIFEMFSFSDEEFSVPSSDSPENELPASLLSEREHSGNRAQNRSTQLEEGEGGDEEDEEDRAAPCIPLADTTPFIQIDPNREDDSCTMRVYMDEHDMSFPLLAQSQADNNNNHNEEESQEQ